MKITRTLRVNIAGIRMQIRVLIKRMELERDRERRSTFDQVQECITIERWQKVRTDNVMLHVRGFLPRMMKKATGCWPRAKSFGKESN